MQVGAEPLPPSDPTDLLSPPPWDTGAGYSSVGGFSQFSWNETQARGVSECLMKLFVGIQQVIHKGRNGAPPLSPAWWSRSLTGRAQLSSPVAYVITEHLTGMECQEWSVCSQTLWGLQACSVYTRGWYDVAYKSKPTSNPACCVDPPLVEAEARATAEGDCTGACKPASEDRSSSGCYGGPGWLTNLPVAQACPQQQQKSGNLEGGLSEHACVLLQWLLRRSELMCRPLAMRNSPLQQQKLRHPRKWSERVCAGPPTRTKAAADAAEAQAPEQTCPQSRPTLSGSGGWGGHGSSPNGHAGAHEPTQGSRGCHGHGGGLVPAAPKPKYPRLQQQGACPNIITQSSWEARETHCSKYVIIIHTVGATCYTSMDCQTHVCDLSYHMDTLEFCDIGYHFLLGQDGGVYEGVGHIQGSNTYGYNDIVLGIAFMGNLVEKPPKAAALEALKSLIQCAVDNRYLTPNCLLVGHSDVSPTLYPGKALYSIINTWPHFKQ
ncbi:LOW QUALITY PROTEIN: peptidoglycan recognition protein 3 [Rhynchonycteris naso]